MSSCGIERFGVAQHGVRWALSSLPEVVIDGSGVRCADLAVSLSGFPAAQGPDDWSLRFGREGVGVLSNSAVGVISAVLELASMLREGRRKNVTRRLKFRTRNYKHEICIREDGPRSVLGYTDAMWERLCRKIVARQFNGLVLYPDDSHPFEHLLDYKEFPYAVKRTDAERAAVREALSRLLATAHRYGLTTFMQHYIGHFTRELADHEGIRETPGGLLSGVDHPEINRYCAWCYREIYRQLPDLDGLYFNFESSPNCYDHVLTVALPEFAKMEKKPVCVFRLWNASSIEGVKSLIKAIHAYGGRVILGHKVADTSDAYHYPVADSRVLEWHKHIPGQEFMFLIGPCHNCGTNLCGQLWADYDYVQDLIGDAHEKGADSISFHSQYELLSEDAGGDLWDEDEKTMSRYNVLHLDAVVDFVNGRSMKRPERARRMARRIGAPDEAGGHVMDLLESTSKIVITVFEQFYHSLAWEGFLNPGRYSHIQDPYYFYPPNVINNTHKLNIWTAPLGTWAWITKTIPVKVAPNNEFEYIIDYVNPARERAVHHPKYMADLMARCVARSFAALEKLRKDGLGAEADRLEKHVKANALVGVYTRAEILAAIELYSLYFAKTKPAMLKALRQGLKRLSPLPAMLERDEFAKKSMARVLYWDWFGAEEEVRRVRELLETIERADFPLAAFRSYVASHRHYNNIRRICRANHMQNARTLAYAAGQIRQSVKCARSAQSMLKGPANATFRANVATWIDYLNLERAHMTPPSTVCPRRFDGTFHAMFHDDCFRMGEHFTEDFLSFFKPVDYERRSGLSFAVWNTGKELAVSWREQGIDIEQRKAQWEKYRGSGSDAFVMRASIDTGDDVQKVIVWPMGQKVSVGMRFVEVRTDFTCDRTTWQTTAYLPYSALGKTPRKGDAWRLNVTANPYVARNRQYTWAPQYDCVLNAELLGRVTFE